MIMIRKLNDKWVIKKRASKLKKEIRLENNLRKDGRESRKRTIFNGQGQESQREIADKYRGDDILVL